MLSEFAQLLRRQLRPFLLVLAVTALAKGTALLPGYSVDDWWPALDGPGNLLRDVGKGRVGHWLFLQMSMALHAEPNAARVSYVLLASATRTGFGLAVVRFWGVRGNGWLPIVSAALIANHPYTCEIFTFRIGLAPAAAVMALLAIVLFSLGAREHAG